MKIRIIDEPIKLDKNKVQSLLREFLKKQIPKGKDIHQPKFPMDFILFKFPELKKILTDLLTVTFKDYLDNVYVVAPKPTTFKVVLKNKQYFTITYDERSYILKVEGKKYYMLNLGEKEEAIKKIADLLNTKKFITSKVDKEKEDEEGDSSSSSGGGSRGGATNHRHTSDGTTLPDAPEGGSSKEGDEDLPDLDSILGGENGGKEKSEKEPIKENIKFRIINEKI